MNKSVKFTMNCFLFVVAVSMIPGVFVAGNLTLKVLEIMG